MNARRTNHAEASPQAWPIPAALAVSKNQGGWRGVGARTGAASRTRRARPVSSASHPGSAQPGNQGGSKGVIAQGQFEALQRAIFAKREQSLYVVLDGAQIDGLPRRLQGQDSACLFAGGLDPMLEAAAPHLVRLVPGSPAADMLREGWNSHWGIVLEVAESVDLAEVRNHLRRCLRVRGPDGSPLLFRFYDPRAFRVVIPTLDADSRKQFFGPIRGFYVEDREPATALYFSRDGGREPRPLPLGARG